MPQKPRKPCNTAGCHGLTSEKYCIDCLNAGKAKEVRPNAHQRGYTREWNNYSGLFRSRNLWCADPFKRHLIPVADADDVHSRANNAASLVRYMAGQRDLPVAVIKSSKIAGETHEWIYYTECI